MLPVVPGGWNSRIRRGRLGPKFRTGRVENFAHEPNVVDGFVNITRRQSMLVVKLRVVQNV